jgi:hypothetical protein
LRIVARSQNVDVDPAARRFALELARVTVSGARVHDQ